MAAPVAATKFTQKKYYQGILNFSLHPTTNFDPFAVLFIIILFPG